MTSRRLFLKSAALGLGALAIAGLAPARAHGGHGHGHHGHVHGQMHDLRTIGSDLVPAQPIPWADGLCAFCNMTLKTPEGDPRGAGFREQTYSQLALADGNTLHFESITCLINYTSVHNLNDGHGTTFYVTDRGNFSPAAPGELVMTRAATFYWGERLLVVMNGRLLAFATPEAAQAFAEAHPEHGRQRLLSFDLLLDLAPLPSANLIPLLARHAGLLE
ncbi:MAG: nitrous oxide reductase accessory protein NosL [Truepera sp.]|nr:nitrous oxide reductase accessory protein NosL [Truepera sp.]